MKANYAYELLTRFCEVRNERNSLRGLENPLTNRATFIVDSILDMELYQGLNLDVFEDTNPNLFYVNIELTINAGQENSVMYVAHHDVNNTNSQNCQDNSASVCNLLALAEHFKNNTPDKTIHIVFTDCEEFGGAGAERLSERIKDGVFGNVEYIVNLELTANGNNLWADSGNFLTESPLLDKLKELNDDLMEVQTPFNDSVKFRKHEIDSVCIGILQDADAQQVRGRGYCQTWAVCHKMNDTIDQAVANDMDNFVQTLINLS
jgi:Iap family predicted aminopeptidase